MKRRILQLILILVSPLIYAQVPNGYYNSITDSMVGSELRLALRDVIKNHTVKSYGDLWDGYASTDMHPGGYIWDMYSHNPNGNQYYTFAYRTKQCGTYRVEGDCYNREHTWPQSKFNDATPMRTDIHLVVPTDGKVNGERGNFPYGVVNNATFTSRNGSKVGNNVYPGAPNSKAFEPIDEYKGDIARIMFYVVTRYYKQDNNWQSWEFADKAELKPWAINMLLEWHRADPVSQKEIDRNNAAYNYQGNRNPYVDDPDWAICVFDPANCPKLSNADTSTVEPDTTGGNTGINEDFNRKLLVYPNPTSNQFNIEFSNAYQYVAYTITDVMGRVCINREHLLNSKMLQLALGDLPKGVYVMQLYADKHYFERRIIKN